MFESAELEHRIDTAVFSRELPALREALLEAQIELVRKASFQVVVLVAGMDGAGRGEIVNLLNQWMDPRHIETHGMGEPAPEEDELPPMCRFWRALPPKGKIALLLGSWYTMPLLERVHRRIRRAQLAQRMQENARFEKMLADEGVLMVKLWMHLSKSQQRERLASLAADRTTRWRVSRRDWEHHRLYEHFVRAAEMSLKITSTAEAPWMIVSGKDRAYRSLTVGRVILEALRKRLDEPRGARRAAAIALPSLPRLDRTDVLSALDLSQRLAKKNYRIELEKAQGRLSLLTRNRRFGEMSVVAVFEGNDAAGKGGAIRRVTAALDARLYQVVPIGAPTDEERSRPYLWRFWRHIPRRGRLIIFDRSWYGRVLVERVEGFCSAYDWMRAYGEINDFEGQLAEHGIVVAKFWLATSKDEQLRRFKEREKTAFKRFKITEEDWRNRGKWGQYEETVCDMIERTSTETAPWTLVEANDKNFGRIKVLKTLCRRIEARLG